MGNDKVVPDKVESLMQRLSLEGTERCSRMLPARHAS